LISNQTIDRIPTCVRVLNCFCPYARKNDVFRYHVKPSLVLRPPSCHGFDRGPCIWSIFCIVNDLNAPNTFHLIIYDMLFTCSLPSCFGCWPGGALVLHELLHVTLDSFSPPTRFFNLSNRQTTTFYKRCAVHAWLPVNYCSRHSHFSSHWTHPLACILQQEVTRKCLLCAEKLS